MAVSGLPCSLVDHVQDCVSSTEVPVGYKSTIVVHCSAGIGRTGVFVAVDSLLRRIRSCVDTLSSHISNTVHTMREHRGGMVQNRVRVFPSPLCCLHSSSKSCAVSWLGASALKVWLGH